MGVRAVLPVLAALLGLVGVGVVTLVPARAESHAVTVQNGAGETIRQIQISASPGASENRLRSQLPPGAVARIGYSAGCQANVRLVFESGRSEDHPGVDACGDGRVVAGHDGVAGPTGPAIAAAAAVPARPAGGKPATTPISTSRPDKAPLPAVPPWTGKSITKRFGGME